MSEIFLSYRRDDEPGYVARLADGLTGAYGAVVFRDVDSIDGGRKWKVELQKRVSQAQILIAVIGRRWESLLAERDPDNDHLRFELNLAQELEIPVIPVQMQDVHISDTLDLGDLSWLRELQFIELSDRQGRWSGDMDNLVECIGRSTTLELASHSDQEQPQEKIREQSRRIWIWLASVNVAVIGILVAAVGTEQIQWIDAQAATVALVTGDIFAVTIRRWWK